MGESGKSGDVLFLHGFPEWASMYDHLMLLFARQGYRCAAYDQRGYSPGAAPNDESDYHYDKLREDIFAMADAIGFERFHLVAHDHGAVLGWYAAGSDRGQARFLTYTSLSIPHPDAFSDGLYGDKADLMQQRHSQYFTIFSLPSSASIKGQLLFKLLGKTSGFESPEAFQKALWWYNGALKAGVLATPPTLSALDLFCSCTFRSGVMRSIFGGTPNPGTPQKARIGKISIPILYIAGRQDMFVLGCNNFALRTEEYC